MGFSYNVSVLNQKGSPAIYTDTFANRPTFGYAGRLFIANDTSAIYEDTGTSWVLIANVSSGAGTLQQVTTNGNTSNVGISITAGGLSTNSLTDTALTLGSVLFAGAAGLVTQDNSAFFWDDTNNRLGLNTVTPSNTLDIHFAGTGASVGINNTAGNQSAIVFANSGTNKWRIGNSATNSFEIYNNALASNAVSISTASNSVSFLASIKIQQGAGFAGVAGYNGIGCDAGGFFFELGTSTNNPYFNFIGLTGARTFTYPDASGTLALTSNLASYLPLSAGNSFPLTNDLTVQGGINLTRGANAFIGTTDNFALTFQTNNVGNRMTISNTGVVSIGSATIAASAILAGVKFMAGGASSFFESTGLKGVSIYPTLSGIHQITSDYVSGSGYLPISISSRGNTLDFYLNTTGNTLIGSNTDDTVNKLQVTGSTILSGTTQISVSNPANSVATGAETLISTASAINDRLNINFSQTGNPSRARAGIGSLSENTNGYAASLAFYTRNAVDSSSLATTDIRMTINSGGIVNIVSLAGTGSRAVIAAANGDLSAPVSDISVKQNIEPLKYGLETILQLNAVQFEFIEDYKNYGQGLQIGAIAQEVEQIIPEAVFTTPLTGLKGINYDQLNGIYIKAIQDLNNIIDALLKRIELLENK